MWSAQRSGLHANGIQETQHSVVSLGQDDGEVAYNSSLMACICTYFLSPVTAFPSNEIMKKIRVDGNHQAEITRCH